MEKKRKNKQNKVAWINHKDLIYKYELLSYLMDHIPDVIYFKDRKGRLIMVNQAHAKGLGLKPEEVVGKTDFDFFSKKRARMMTKDDTYVMTTGKPIINKVERATRPDGVDNYVSTTKIPRYNEKGKIIGLVGITRDITQRMRFRRLKERKEHIEEKLEMLEEMNKLKSEFVSTVSHELRTPLAIIKQLLTLVFNETAGPINEKQKEILKRSKNNIERLKNIIDELLDISRIERDSLKLHYSLVNLNDLLKDSSEFFKELAQEKGISLNYYFPRDEVNIFIDAERINQVVSNLIDNAIKFTEEDGEIKVEVKILESKVRVGVFDTGVGIAKSDLPQLFNKFIQVSKVTSAERKGVGLGLSITKELVERHGGEIWVESKLGVGSKFYFTLPRFYEVDAMDAYVKEKVNDLLDKDISIYFINLLIVNYREFKKEIKIGPKRLFEDLKVIIETTFEEVYRSNVKKSPIVLTDIQSGKCSIIFSEATEEKVTKLSNLLRDRVKNYFMKNKAEDVFIALGILSYPPKAKPPETKQFPANIHIKKICIGLEKRHFPRVIYEAKVRIFLPEDKTQVLQTVDISEGGISFVTKKLLETNSQIKMSLELPKNKRPIYAMARVAWRKKMERMSTETTEKYKIGLEFINLKNKDKKIISKKLKL